MSTSIQFANWRDFRVVGLDYLTGESCGLMLRGLIDFTQRGQRLLCKALGLPMSTKFAESWNSGSPAFPHVGSIMLPHSMMEPLSIFACLETEGITQCYLAYNDRGEWVGTFGFDRNTTKEDVDEWISFMEGFKHRLRRYAYEGTAGDRNRHEMTGRAE